MSSIVSSKPTPSPADCIALVTQLSAELTACQHELKRLHALTAIQNCMGYYEAIHLNPTEIWRTPECFALWRPDCSVEVSDWGCFFGPEAIRGFWAAQTGDDLRGGIFFHTLTTACIEVAGDGKTAKATWASPGFETMPPLQADDQHRSFWCWGKYGVDFIRHPDTGEWKIWHMKWFRTIRSDFYRSWYDDAKNTLKGMPGPKGFDHPGRRPSVFHRPYAADEIPHPFPMPPQPYQTYDGTFRWIFGDADYEKTYDVQYPAYEALYHVDYPGCVA